MLLALYSTHEGQLQIKLRSHSGCACPSWAMFFGNTHGPTPTRGGAARSQCAVPSALQRAPTLTPTIIFFNTNDLLPLTMSHTYPTAASSSSPSPSSTSSNFQFIINNALDTYKKRTRKDLRAHPLAAQLQTCESPTAILAVLQQQVQGVDQSRSANEQWTKWLDPTVNVLYAFSDILGAGVSLVCLTTCTSVRSIISYSCGSFSLQLASFLQESGSSCQCVSLIPSRGPI
jgi:hypothetical protein